MLAMISLLPPVSNKNARRARLRARRHFLCGARHGTHRAAAHLLRYARSHCQTEKTHYSCSPSPGLGSDNLGLDYVHGGAWLFGAYGTRRHIGRLVFCKKCRLFPPPNVGTVGSLVYVLGAPMLDRLPALPMAALMTALAGSVRALVPSATEAATTQNGIYVFFLLQCVLVPALDVLTGAAVVLAIKRLVDVKMLGHSKAETKEAQDYWFGWQYVIFNGGALVADLLYDRLRLQWAPSPAIANQWTLWLAGASLGVAATLFTVTKVVLIRKADHAHILLDVQLGGNPCYTLCFSPREVRGRFWRFCALCTVLFGVKSLFRHMEATLDIYMTRAIGPDAHFTLVQAINPAIVMLLCWWLPNRLFGRFTYYTRFVVGIVLLPPPPPFPRMLSNARRAGTTVSVAGPLLLPLGLGFVSTSPVGMTLMLALSVTLFSLGEIIWSPLLGSYATSFLAPKGTEAIFGALAAIPSLAAKLPTSAISARVVAAYCPADGVCQGVELWGVITLIAATTPLCLLLFERCLREQTLDNEGL